MAGHGGPSALDHANIYEAVLAELEAVVLHAAPAKQVRMPQGHAAHVAEQAAELLDLADHFRLLCRDEGALRRAADAAHRAIDAHYLIQVGVRIAHHFGVPEAAASYVPIFVAGAVNGLHGESGAKEGYAWPDPDAFAQQMLLSQPSANLFWQPPEGGQASLWMRFWSASETLVSEVHRPSGEGPAFERTDAAGRALLQVYMEHGKRHRDPAEGPAFIQRAEERGSVYEITEYWVDGVHHRPSNQGPAVIETDERGRVLLEIYMEHSKRHRDPAQGPAFFAVETIDGMETSIVEYYGKPGELHRLSSEGPAVLRTDAQGRVLLEAYMEHGVHHRDPSQGPALIQRDAATGAVLCEEYRRNGLLHRDEEEGPAAISSAPGAAKSHPHHESYYADGEPHRLRGPAIVERCPDTGEVIHEWHHRHGLLHRNAGPAIILRPRPHDLLRSLVPRWRAHRRAGRSIQWA